MADASPKKKVAAKPKKPAAHPKYSDMVGKTIAALKERGGSSRQAILKYIMANFNVGKDAKTVNVHLKLSPRAGVNNKTSFMAIKITTIIKIGLMIFAPLLITKCEPINAPKI